MLRHEVGNPLLRLSSKLSELSEGTEGLAPELQRDLRYLAGELAYVRALATEIADFPNPNQPLPLSFVLVRNQVSSFWAKLFRQLIAADPTAMSIVRLVVGREKNMTSISYSAVERTDLENLPWPPAPCVSVQHLRQILQNLVNNSMKRGGAKSIEVEVGVTEAPRGYVKLTLRDDGRPYLRSEGDVRFRFGELIISRIFESIRQEFPKAGFHTPDEGAKGRKKTFSMILPLA
jgi:signal transduction histidine kinase